MNGGSKALAGGIATAVIAAAALGTALLWRAGKAPGNRGANNAQPAAAVAAPPTVHMLANWHVRYEDADQGIVDGKAIVDWEKGHAAVTLDGLSTNKVTLSADDVQLDKTNTHVTMRLRQSGFQGPPIKPANTGGTPIPAAAGQQLTIQPSDPSFSATVLDKQRPDGDGVRLNLRAGNFGALLGEWSYLADPITKRNASGSGRSGYFRLLNDDELQDPNEGFIGEQSGIEEWWPLPTEIACSAVMESQLASKNGFAVHPYPFGSSFVNGSHQPDEKGTTRTLFVVGRNFPYDPVQGRVLQQIRWSDYDNIKAYRIVALSTDPNLDAKGKQQIEDGWNKTLQALDASMKQTARQNLDAAIVVVEMKQGILPGPKHFYWGDGEGVWFLQFGDNVADASFARPVRTPTANGAHDEFERTQYVFLPETLALEIHTRALLPQDTIPMQVATKSNLAGAVTVQVTRVGKNQNVYRTQPPVPISKSGGGYVWNGLTFNPGDELVATVRVDDLPFSAQPEAHATALLTPDQLSRLTGSGGNSAPASCTKVTVTIVRLWKDALVCAAGADNLGEENLSLSELAGHNLPAYRGVPVTVGQHAAMLLLRTEFLTMMQEQQANLAKLHTDNDVEAFREWVRPLMANRSGGTAEEGEYPSAWAKYKDYLDTIDDLNKLRSWLQSRPLAGAKAALDALDTRKSGGYGKGTYFGELPVTGPGGGTWPYFSTYWDDKDLALDRFFHGDAVKLRDWRIRAGREVLARYQESVKSTIASVQGIHDSDVPQLLKLTGIGFGPVVYRILPELMSLDDAHATAQPQWIPDLNARAGVASLAELAGAVRGAEDYSGALWSATIEVVSAALAWNGAGAFFSEATAETVTWAAQTGIMFWQLGEEFYDQFVVIPKQLDQFLGASAVLGADRLEETNARNVTIGAVVEQLATQFAIDSVWGKIESETSPIVLPKPGSGWLHSPSPPSVVLAAELPKPRKVRSFAVRILQGLGSISADRTIGRLRELSLETLKQWPKEQIQRYLQLAERGADLERGGPASRAEVEAQFLARRLKLEADHAVEPNPELAINYGEPAPDPKPPAVGKDALPGIGPATAQRPPPRPVVPRPPAAVAEPRVLPFTGGPARKNDFIAVQENEGWVEYKTPGVDANGQPIKLAPGGASAEVYAVVKIIGRDQGNLLQGDGIVLKVIKDDPRSLQEISLGQAAEHMGSAREQVLRMQEVHNLLKQARSQDPGIEFAEVLEFHPDASKPYLIQRRLNFDGKTLLQIDPKTLLTGKLPDAAKINANFPPPMQRAFAVLYFRLALQGLISPDLSLKNVYFRKVGDQWVCGILDIDHIVQAQSPAPVGTHVTWDWVRQIHEDQAELMPSFTYKGTAVATSLLFMEAMFQYPMGGNSDLPFVYFSDAQQKLVQGLMEPDVIKKASDQAYGEYLRRRGR
jgi:hypothetical protein